MKRLKSIPILILAAFLPLVFFFHMETIDFAKYPWFPNQGYWLDLFLYGKTILLQVISAGMAIGLLVYKFKNKKNERNANVILLAVLFIMILLSTMFSRFPKESVCGSIEQYESVGVLVSYLIMGIYCVKFSDQENSSWIAKALITGLIISSILGVLQFFQLDFWNTGIGKSLLIPESHIELRESLRFSKDAEGFGRVYMALYNPTYAGIYIVMLLPLLAFSKKKLSRILLIPVGLCLVGTMSKTAWLAFILVMVLGYWMMSKPENVKKKKFLFAGATVFVLLLIFVLPISSDGVVHEKKQLQEVVGEEEHIRIVYGGNTLYFSEYPKDDGVTYKIVDEAGNKLKLFWVEERGELDSLDPRFEELHFKVYKKDDIGYAVFRYNDVVFRFTNDLGTGKYEYVSMNGKTDKIVTVDHLFETGDAVLNGRGYIWKRIIPLIADNALLGTGPDTFLQVFPQNDYVARANLGYGFFSEILTNAHNLYLQIGLQNGLIVLACIIWLLINYISKTWKFYAHKDDYDEMDRVGIACFLGSIGYLICGFTFASSICTTPIFIILMGITIGSQKREQQKNV